MCQFLLCNRHTHILKSDNYNIDYFLFQTQNILLRDTHHVFQKFTLILSVTSATFATNGNWSLPFSWGTWYLCITYIGHVCPMHVLYFSSSCHICVSLNSSISSNSSQNSSSSSMPDELASSLHLASSCRYLTDPPIHPHLHTSPDLGNPPTPVNSHLFYLNAPENESWCTSPDGSPSIETGQKR